MNGRASIRLGVSLLLAGAVFGCIAEELEEEEGEGTAAQQAAAACEPPPPPSLGAADALSAGRYELTLVAESGEAAGERVTGSLTLHPLDAAEAGPSGADFRGAAEVSLGDVGARTQGGIASDAADAPGVLAMRLVPSQGSDQPRILVRLGSELNRMDGRTPIEGAYTVLRVHGVGTDGFDGRWESGGTGGPSGGYFCARTQ